MFRHFITSTLLVALSFLGSSSVFAQTTNQQTLTPYCVFRYCDLLMVFPNVRDFGSRMRQIPLWSSLHLEITERDLVKCTLITKLFGLSGNRRKMEHPTLSPSVRRSTTKCIIKSCVHLSLMMTIQHRHSVPFLLIATIMIS